MTVVDERTVAPSVSVTAQLSPGTRLVPARIGTWAHNQVMPIPCPSWCVEDHLEFPSAFEDISHYGEPQTVAVPSFLGGTDVHYVWWARLESDPAASDERMRAAHLIVGDDSTFEARVSDEMADKLADDLIVFAMQLRQQARAARQANRAAA
ncbi:DUF6907 domain-containing protein [Streptomyces sp. NPDC101175]|uniref:DUF6907 domain-containing protein n=1 Tax=Streptomyces sp. NPDC101175 TaxID=3366123 RepID=UPI003835B636